ncbi:hypothetical protein Csa_004046 [Cucumis sativus]|uniref:Uncharacterized protein n=1 Tax=Cucumis sativus TaxID=3659 RepID=A0A0A0KL18_CUCSA|nr:hypothetical protein Csa_004046 [Cucumis sativus]
MKGLLCKGVIDSAGPQKNCFGVELLGEVFRQHSFYSAKKSKAAQLQFLKFSSSSSSFLDHLLLSVDTKEKLGWAANVRQNGPENSC